MIKKQAILDIIYKAVFNNSPYGIIVADAMAKRFIFANPNMSRISRYSNKELLKMSMADLHTKKDLPHIKKVFSDMTKGRIRCAKAIPVLRKDKKIIYCDIKCKKLVIEKKTYLIGFFRDCTEKEKIRQELVQKEEKMNKIINSSPSAIIVTDLKDNITECNKAAIRLHRFASKKELIGKPFYRLIAKESWKKASEARSKALEKGIIKNIEVKLVTKNNKKFPAEISASILKDINDKPAGFIIISQDILARKKSEDIIRNEMEKLKDISQTKTNFLNIVSHELKTPLTAIHAHLELLEDSRKALPEPVLVSFEAIKRNCSQLKTLISNLLEISRIEAKSFSLHITSTDLEECISSVITKIKLLADKKNISLKTKIGKLPKIKADKARIKQVLINLINNAIKFTEKGSITVTARKKGSNVQIDIKDTGIGIQKEKLEQIFEKFYQIDSSLGRRYGGTGLGLAIAKELVELHGGKMKVKSKLGKGSTFKVILPIKKVRGDKK